MSTRATPISRAAGAEDAALAVRAGAGLVLALLRTGDFQRALGRRLRARSRASSQRRRSARCAAMRCGRWADSRKPKPSYDAALARRSGAAARPPRARAIARRRRTARAGLIEARKRCGSARATRSSITRSRRSTSACAASTRRPRRSRATSICCRIAIAARRPRGRAPRSASSSRSRGRVPFDIESQRRSGIWTMPIRIRGDKVTVTGRVNGGPTGVRARHRRRAHGHLAGRRAPPRRRCRSRHADAPASATSGCAASKSDASISLEIGDLKVRNVPCLIKNPPLGGLPAREPESFSPLALGLSMRVDYSAAPLTMAGSLEPATYTDALPLRMHRLALVRGTVNGSLPGDVRRRHRRRADLDQRCDRRPDPARPRRSGESRCVSTARPAGTRTRS